MFCRETLVLPVLSLPVVSDLMATTTRNPSVALQKMSLMLTALAKNHGQWDATELPRAKLMVRRQSSGEDS